MKATGFRLYRGTRGEGLTDVVLEDGTTHPLPHLVHHSPTGFEWGYGGSGPADLARSIVGYVLDEKDPHPLAYQAVKWDLLAPLPHEGGTIPLEAVLAILHVEKRDGLR